MVVIGVVGAVLAGCAGDPGFERLKTSVLASRSADGWTVPLNELGLDGTMAHVAAPHPWHVRQVSSFDRSGGASDDRGGQQVYEGGILLADLKGPGSVMRIWSHNPWGRLHIYVDDLEHPIITAPFQDIFSGELELFSPGFNLFAPPFVGEGSGGYYSYVPIPFEKACRIVVTGDNDPLAYQVTYAEFAPGTPIRSFQLDLTHDDVNYFRNWRDNWNARDFRYSVQGVEEIHGSTTIIWPQSNTHIASINGPAFITEVEMNIDSFDPSIFENAWIAIYFDRQEEPGVLAPIGAFFGKMDLGAADYSSVALGNLEGRMWCRYPMPFKNYAEIRLINLTDSMADFTYNLTHRPGAIGDQRYFYARHKSGTSESGRPYRIADLRGEGHFAGASIKASNANSLTFLEGDDTYLVDGEPASNFHGTGMDDYFNMGWYFSTGPYSGPTHGATFKDASSPVSASAYRNHIMEVVPFVSSFSFQLEHGTRNNQPGIQYRSVAYWYQDSATAALWDIPALEEVNLDRH
jgi:hypothetical protein